MGPKKIFEGIYQVGGPDMSHPYDCSVYLVDLGELILIDAGLGMGVQNIVANIEVLGLDPTRLSTLLLTHCHIDHMGGASWFRERFGTRLVMHTLDADILERGDNRLTAAFCFNIDFTPVAVDLRLQGEKTDLLFPSGRLSCLHTPGHTPGSISLYTDLEEARILFVQDIQAPLLGEFDCDPLAWSNSVKKLLSLKGDILCDGHNGIWQPARSVQKYLQHAANSH
jgi:glyoxylase-like metal-dependent hydrolase (beta-lactamase superfamily II)